MWADKVAGIWGERAETEDLFIALIYYGTSLLFIVIGNYLPKIKQNNTIGIRIVWTLQDEENWNATAAIAKEFAESEFEKYRVIQDSLYESDFDKLMNDMEKDDAIH